MITLLFVWVLRFRVSEGLHNIGFGWLLFWLLGLIGLFDLLCCLLYCCFAICRRWLVWRVWVLFWLVEFFVFLFWCSRFGVGFGVDFVFFWVCLLGLDTMFVGVDCDVGFEFG